MTSRPDDDRLPTDEEIEAARLVVACVGRRFPTMSFTLDILMGFWADLVEDVEEGYSNCPPELDNDVWCREALEQVWLLLPDGVRVAGQAELDDLDRRYRAATIPWPGRDDERAWWTWRIPRRLQVPPDEPVGDDWPRDWGMMPFPKPDSIEIIR